MRTKTIIAAFFCCAFFLSCKNKSTTQIGEIHSNDSYSNKIQDLLKAFEAKDSATFSSMLADDFRFYDETKSPWIDNDYFKDTSKHYEDKRTYIHNVCFSLSLLNSVKYENPVIMSYYFSNGDTITTVKAYYTAIGKTDSAQISYPSFRVFKWKGGKISQLLKYTNKEGLKVLDEYSYGDYTVEDNREADFRARDYYGYEKNQIIEPKDSSKIKR